MAAGPTTLQAIQSSIWHGALPLEIRLASIDCINGSATNRFYILCPRLSYLPLLLDKILNYFLPHLSNPTVRPCDGWFTYELVPLRWHFPVGLLYDLYSGASGHSIDQPDNNGHGANGSGLPWRIEVHFSNWPAEQLIPLDPERAVLRDAFTNSMKEASYLRTGTGKVAMSLGRDDSTALWQSVVDNDLALFRPVQTKLLWPPGVSIRHIPLKVYLPATDSGEEQDASAGTPTPGHLRVMQSLVTPRLNSRQPQTLGTALNTMLPTLFPSRRSPLLAMPVLHGAIVPLSVNLEELAEFAGYADGWVHLVINMM